MNGDSPERGSLRTKDEQVECPDCGRVFDAPDGGRIPQHFITISTTHRYECSGSGEWLHVLEMEKIKPW